MRRLLIAIFASLLSMALIAPGAQAASRIRYFQDLSGSDGQSQIDFSVGYMDRHGNKRFTPRTISYSFVVPVSCVVGGNPSIDGLSGTGPPVKLRKGKFAHAYSHWGPSPIPSHPGTSTGYVKGKLIKKTKRVDGSINVQDYESPPTFMNCASVGAISFSATPCRTPSGNSSLPVCGLRR